VVRVGLVYLSGCCWFATLAWCPSFQDAKAWHCARPSVTEVLLSTHSHSSIGVNPRVPHTSCPCVPVSLLPVANDVSLDIPHEEQLTVARLRQFLSSADRLGLLDSTVVVCTAVVATGAISSLRTQISRTVPDAEEHEEEA
jgi:hypothetical protein